LNGLARPREEAEIVIVGGGPAGSTAAAALADLGHDVLLVDKDAFPREKPCGDGVMHPGLAVAERMGLGDLVESSFEIESTRIVIGHRRQITTPHVKGPGRPLPRCIIRKEFDAALLSAAQERGARFVRARVDALGKDGNGRRLLAVSGEERLEVQANLIIAADGATSRLRRVMGGQAAKPTAYAIRQYFKCEQPLEPVLQFDLPLEVNGRVLPGYGWLFPIDEHTANVGVGVFREARGRGPSLRKVLDIYVAELGTKAARRFGDLEAIGEPVGSPVGIRSRLEVADSPGLIFLGDAAGTTHPMTGEGISFAMCGGESLAATVHERSKRADRRQAATGADGEVWRSFPQLGVDTSLLVRASMLEVNKAPSAIEPTGSIAGPFLSTVEQFAHESAYKTGVEDTPAWAALDACSPSLGASLERANDLLLDRFSDRTPFVTEMIHASIRSHLGPMYAAAVLATTASEGGTVPDTVFEAAVAAESVGVLPEMLTMLVDRARSKRLRVNNAMAVLTGDFAATRALMAAAKLGPTAVTALARAGQSGCQGGMRDTAARFAADRTAESWFEAAKETAGAAMVLATQFGMIVRGESGVATERLSQFGLELGVAIRLAEEIVDLTVGDGIRPGQEGVGLVRGIYPLPVLYAIESEPSLPRLLAHHTAEKDGAAEIIAVVRQSGALERAVAECADRVDVARSLAETQTGDDGKALSTLAAVPADYVASRVSADALEAC
jgi:geranylgeranyl reductase family protein